MKTEQQLVNLIDSITHFQLKCQGVQVFYRFLAEKWPVDAFFYFLVLRGLLEQVTNDRILDKVNTNRGQGSQRKTSYRIRSNPYDKNVSEEEVSLFLGILQGEGLFCSKNRPKSF